MSRLINTRGKNLSLSTYLRLLLLATEEPKDGDGELQGGNEPQTVLHEAGSLGDEAAGDGADEGEGEGDGALVPLGVLGEGGEDVGVADEVAEQGGDDDGGHLGDAEAAAVDDLAGGLEREQRDGRQLGEVDVLGVPPRRVSPVDQPALDDARRQRHEDRLHQERHEHGAPLPPAPDQRVEPREAHAAYYEGADGRHWISRRQYYFTLITNFFFLSFFCLLRLWVSFFSKRGRDPCLQERAHP